MNSPASGHDRPLTRRTFLKRAAAVGAGWIVAGTPPAVVGQAKRDEVLVGLFNEPKTITPMLRRSLTDTQVGSQLYDPVTRLEDPEALTIRPWLAEAWAQESPTTYVFKLRKGVLWHKDYGELTADDAVWTYNTRIELAGRGGALSYVDRAEPRDKYTFAIKLQKPYGAFTTVWSHTHWATIHCRRAFEEMGQEKFTRNPIGSGPFELEEWRPGVHIKLRRFKKYWRPDLPKVERLHITFVPDSFVKVEKLRKGELDWIDSPSYSDLPALQKTPGLKLVNPVGDEWDYMAVNLTLPKDHPLQHPKVREAIAYAINRNAIVKNVYFGNAKPTDLPFVPPFPGSEFPPKYPMDGDSKKAQQLLKEAGFGNGFEVGCITSAKSELRDSLVVIAAQLGQIGIKVKIQNLDMAGYEAATVKLGARAGQPLTYELAFEDISLAGPDSDSCVSEFFYSTVDTYSRYKNPEMDRAIDKGQVSTDVKERRQAYAKVAELIHRDNPMIFTVFPRLAFGQHAKLAGFRPSRTEFNISFDSIHWTA